MAQGGDLEKGESAGAGGAVVGSAGFEYIIPAGIAIIVWISWVAVNLQLQSSSAVIAPGVWAFSAYPFAFQASTFSVAITLAWLASSRGNATYALASAIFNWICVCCWLIYILPSFGFNRWNGTNRPECFFSPKLPIYNDDVCNSLKAAGIFSLFIVTINFAWFIIYMIKGVSAFKFSGGLKSVFSFLAILNLFGYLLAFAGQLRLTDKFGSGDVTDTTYTYIITFMVGICTCLMFAHDMIDNAFHLIWHPITASIIWSGIILFARATDGKYGVTTVTDDAGKAIAAGLFMMAASETIASILAVVFKFQGNV